MPVSPLTGIAFWFGFLGVSTPSPTPDAPTAEPSAPLEPKPPERAPNEWAVLGGVRFVLAVVVMFSHFNNVVQHFDPWYQFWELGSLAAVVGFFLISGYSIANSIEKKPKGYFVRRYMRIYPLYFSVLVLSALLYFMGPEVVWPLQTVERPSAASVVGCIFLLQGFFIKVPWANSPLWTLSIEVFYYLFAPLFKRTPLVVLSILIAVSGAVYWTGWHPNWDGPTWSYARQLYGFSAGAFLWAWLLGFAFYFARDSAAAQVALVCVPVFLICRNNQLGGYYAPLTLAAVAMVMINARRFPLDKGVAKFLNYLGDLSYPLYLVHVPSIAYTWRIFHTLNAPVYIAMAIMLAAALFHTVDQPLRRPKH